MTRLTHLDWGLLVLRVGYATLLIGAAIIAVNMTVAL